MKSETILPLPTLWGKVRDFSRKVIIFLIIIRLSLSAILLPYLISSFTSFQPTYKSYIITEDKSKQKIDDYIAKLEEEGYKNLSFVPKKAEPIINIKQKEFLDNFSFYADYVELIDTKENNKYLFKNEEESQTFLKQLKKYKKADYQQENIKTFVNNETSQETLNTIIIAKNTKAKKEEEQLKQKRILTQNITVRSQPVDRGDMGLVNYALQFQGNPYIHGGVSLTNGADCSGFVQTIYATYGISLPRTSAEQSRCGYAVAYDQLQPGDLIFYSGNGGYSVTHVAIYIGNGQIIHAQTPAKGIGVTSMNIMIKMGARRVN